jgi:hypothetical protein
MLNSMAADNLVELGNNARTNIEHSFERSAHWQNMLGFYTDQLSKLNKH